MFAPRNVHEFAHVVAPRGLLLTVIPAPGHLREARETLHLLNIEPHKQQRVVDQFQCHFTMVHTTKLEYPLRLSAVCLDQFLTMTPSYWHRRGRTPAKIDYIDTQAAFMMLLFQRKA